MRRVAPGAMLVHFKDGVKEADGTWVGRLAGEGEIPLEESLRALAEAGYDGCESVEYEVPADYKVGIPHDVKHLRALLGKIGCLG